MIDKIKIVGVMPTGSYNSWEMWCCASMYNVVDSIICVNGGISVSSPDQGGNIPLERAVRQLKEIDVDNKIKQIQPNIKHTRKFRVGKDEAGRAGNIELCFRYAYSYANEKGWDLGNTWVLKMDSDETLESDVTRGRLLSLIHENPKIKGFRIAMYSDFYREWGKCVGLPDDFTNDAAVFFNNPDAYSVGQGSPCVGSQEPAYDIRSYHLRSICPPDLDEYTYFFERFYYHLWGPNSIMELPENRDLGRKLSDEEIRNKAIDKALNTMKSYGHTKEHFNNDERFPPGKPLVVELGPLEYIKQGYPR